MILLSHCKQIAKEYKRLSIIEHRGRLRKLNTVVNCPCLLRVAGVRNALPQLDDGLSDWLMLLPNETDGSQRIAGTRNEANGVQRAGAIQTWQSQSAALPEITRCVRLRRRRGKCTKNTVGSVSNRLIHWNTAQIIERIKTRGR